MDFSKKFVVVLICLCELSTITLCRPCKNNHTSKPHRICFPGEKVPLLNGECTCSEDGRKFQCPTTTPKPQHHEEKDIINISDYSDIFAHWNSEEEKDKQMKEMLNAMDHLGSDISPIDTTVNREIPASEIDVPEFDIKLEEAFHPVL